MLKISRSLVRVSGNVQCSGSISMNLQFTKPCCRPFHSSRPTLGIEEFFDNSNTKEEAVVTGRAWTAADLRRKSYSDLHALWWVLYKERNLLLTARERARRASRPYAPDEEGRYLKVKRSMAGIKHVINERKDIDMKLNPPPEDHNKTPGRRTRIFPKEDEE